MRVLDETKRVTMELENSNRRNHYLYQQNARRGENYLVRVLDREGRNDESALGFKMDS